jgi:hypothetical protein
MLPPLDKSVIHTTGLDCPTKLPTHSSPIVTQENQPFCSIRQNRKTNRRKAALAHGHKKIRRLEICDYSVKGYSHVSELYARKAAESMNKKDVDSGDGEDDGIVPNMAMFCGGAVN